MPTLASQRIQSLVYICGYTLNTVLTANSVWRVFLGGEPIPVVKEHKFLGLIFDNKLNFIPHIKYLKAKCKKALNILKVVSHYDWGADCKVLLRLYRALVRSKLDYGSIVYGSSRASYIKCLDPIHNQGLRLCLGAFRTSPMESLYVRTSIHTICIKIKIHPLPSYT